MSIGELFIQLGVLGNANELKKANSEFQKSNLLKEKQIKLDKIEAELQEKLKKVHSAADKAALKRTYEDKKAKVAKEYDLKLKTLEHQKLQQNTAAMATYMHAAIAVGQTVYSVAQKISNLTTKLTQQNNVWANIKRSTSESLNTFSKYAYVASNLNGALTSESAAGQLSQLQQQLATAWMPGSGDLTPLMQLIGQPINRNMGVDDVIKLARKRLQGMPPEMQSYFANQAGLGDFLPLFQQSESDFNKTYAQLQSSILPEQDRTNIEEYRRQLDIQTKKFEAIEAKLGLALLPLVSELRDAFIPVAEDLMPIVTESIKTITSYAKDNMPAIEDGLKVLVETVKIIAIGVENLAISLGWLGKGIKWLTEPKDILNPQNHADALRNWLASRIGGNNTNNTSNITQNNTIYTNESVDRINQGLKNAQLITNVRY